MGTLSCSIPNILNCQSDYVLNNNNRIMYQTYERDERYIAIIFLNIIISIFTGLGSIK